MNKDIYCFLEEDINTCPHYDCINHECKDNVMECGMFNKNYIVKATDFCPITDGIACP